jgi:hypothetical protein
MWLTTVDIKDTSFETDVLNEGFKQSDLYKKITDLENLHEDNTLYVDRFDDRLIVERNWISEELAIEYRDLLTKHYPELEINIKEL